MRLSGRAQRPVLIPFSFLFGIVVRLRNFLYNTGFFKSERFAIPVISVGNITVGGTGKTPHVEYMVKLLKDVHHLAVLSRGYKRHTRNFILAGENSTVGEIGDEPKQIKQKFPDVHVAVDRNRVNGIHTLHKLLPGLNLVILDDAFQHRKVSPGLSIVLIDYNRPLFKDMMLPAGNLREPAKNIDRADVVIVTKCPGNLTIESREQYIARLETKTGHIFFTTFNYGNVLPVFPNHDKIKGFANAEPFPTPHLLLITGIANPVPLREYLSSVGQLAGEMVFPDHHHYRHNDILAIQKRFHAIKADQKLIVVTEKDAVRLRELSIPDDIKRALHYIPIDVRFLYNEEPAFKQLIYQYMKGSLPR